MTRRVGITSFTPPSLVLAFLLFLFPSSSRFHPCRCCFLIATVHEGELSDAFAFAYRRRQEGLAVLPARELRALCCLLHALYPCRPLAYPVAMSSVFLSVVLLRFIP
jgi:hypothetical protein